MATAKTNELSAATIYDASKAEIIKFASEVAGIEFNGEESREWMISEICGAMDWAQRDPADGATHVVVKIGKTAEQGGSLDVRGGFNGKMFTIQREKEVTIPIEYYNVLMDANSVGFTIAPMDKAKPNSPDEERIEKSAYPIQVLRFLKKG